jgi:hypothetical protein
MRRLTFKIFWSLSLIYYRHFNFSWGSKRVKIFHFVLNLNWGCSKCVQICSICVLNVAGAALFACWMLQELLYLGPEQRLRRQSSSICVQNLYRATPATFRMQIEQWLQKMRDIKQPIIKRHWKSELFQDTNTVEQFECIQSGFNLGSKQNIKFERFWSLSLRT